MGIGLADKRESRLPPPPTGWDVNLLAGTGRGARARTLTCPLCGARWQDSLCTERSCLAGRACCPGSGCYFSSWAEPAGPGGGTWSKGSPRPVWEKALLCWLGHVHCLLPGPAQDWELETALLWEGGCAGRSREGMKGGVRRGRRTDRRMHWNMEVP